MRTFGAALALGAFLAGGAAAQEPAPTSARDLEALLPRDSAAVRTVLADRAHHRLQILLAEPVPRGDGTIGLRRSRLGEDDRYFYPASSIKLCGALAVLLQLGAHNRAHGTAFGLDTELVVEPRFSGDVRVDRDDSNLDGGHLTLRHALRKLFLVSDNAAYNHCVELVGQRALNETMWQAGFTSARLRHRLAEARAPHEHGQTRPIRLRAGGDALLLPARDLGIDLDDNDAWRDLEIGTAHLRDGERIPQPMSFAHKNAISLRDLQDLLVEVVRPEIDTGKRGFPELTIEQRAFLVEMLGALPSESRNPRFDPERVPDHACKFVLRGVARVVPLPHLRVYDKIGRAYGFSIENAYVEDRRTGAGFFLALVLYTNPDGVLNDDAYGYDEVAVPFLDDVGEALARAVFGG